MGGGKVGVGGRGAAHSCFVDSEEASVGLTVPPVHHSVQREVTSAV